jgi:hypothetical protein
MATTPNMLLPVPDDHTDADTWGLALNAVFGVSGGGIDAHDHSTGKGVQVPSAGIGINADLSFAAFALTTAKAVTFNQTTTASVAGYTNALFVNSADHNLYFRNNSGSNVQITAGSTINVSLVGGIGGDYSSVSALLSYVDANKDYLLQQQGSPRPWAGLETGDIKLFQKAASISNAVTLKSPAALAASYTMTMPTGLPGSTSVLAITNAGVISGGMPANADVTVSGTGSFKHGTKTTSANFIGSLANVSAGSVSTTGGSVGALMANNTIFRYPVPAVPQHARIVNVTVYFDSAAGRNDCTVTLDQTSAADPATRTFSATGLTLTPSGTALSKVSGANLQATAGRQYWLNISNSLTTPTCVSVVVDWDVP